MTCHRNHQLQILDLNPRALNRESLRRGQDVAVVYIRVDQYRPSSGQKLDTPELTAELELFLKYGHRE